MDTHSSRVGEEAELAGRPARRPGGLGHSVAEVCIDLCSPPPPRSDLVGRLVTRPNSTPILIAVSTSQPASAFVLHQRHSEISTPKWCTSCGSARLGYKWVRVKSALWTQTKPKAVLRGATQCHTVPHTGTAPTLLRRPIDSGTLFNASSEMKNRQSRP